MVSFKRTIIDSPDNMAGSVDSDGDVHSESSVGIGGCDGIHRYRIGKRIVKTGGRGVYLSDRIGARGGTIFRVFIVDHRQTEGLIGGFGACAGCDL